MSAFIGFMICILLTFAFTVVLAAEGGAAAAIAFWTFIFGLCAFCYGLSLMGIGHW